MQMRRRDGRCKGDWSIIVENDLALFSEYWPNTDSVTPARRYAFQCADILDVWIRTIGRSPNITAVFVAILEPSGAPLLLLPLCIERQYGIRILKFMDSNVSDYNAPIVFPAACDWEAGRVQVLWEDLKSRLPPFDLALFEKMPTVVEDWPNPIRFLSTGKYCQSGHCMVLPSDWDSAEKTILPDHADSRRRARKLGALGEISFSVAQTEAEALEYLKTFMELKAEQFRRTLGYNRFVYDPGYAEYYVEATKAIFHRGSINSAALKLDSEILSASWGYVVSDRLYWLTTAYRNEPKWKPYAPGRLLMEFLMKWSTKRGLKTFDFGVGDEPYKNGYRHVPEQLYEARLPTTVMGQTLAVARAAKDQMVASLEGTRFKESLKDAVRAAERLLRPE